MILTVASQRFQSRLSIGTPCSRSIDAAPAHLSGRSYLAIGSYTRAEVFIAVLEAVALASIFGAACFASVFAAVTLASAFAASGFCRTGRLAVLVTP